MSSVDDLHREAYVFGRLLTATSTPPRALEAYVEAHTARPELSAGDPFQTRLVAQAARGVFRARMADGFARFVDPYGPLRRKLVLLLAILECTPPTHRTLDAPIASGMLGTLVRLVGYGLRSVFCTALGMLWLMPLRWRLRSTR